LAGHRCQKLNRNFQARSTAKPSQTMTKCAYSARTTVQKHFHSPLMLISTLKVHGNKLRELTFLVDNLSDSEQRRIRDIQHQIFDKLPPTATVFNQGSHWSLECEIPLPVLERLSTDLVARCVDSVSIKIEWPFGFIDNLSGAWGFFEGGQLRGHVSSFTWSLLIESLRSTHDPAAQSAQNPQRK
jgi:hypothetical protein